jgi:ABC-2 type transport system ATP-binding protein
VRNAVNENRADVSNLPQSPDERLPFFPIMSPLPENVATPPETAGSAAVAQASGTPALEVVSLTKEYHGVRGIEDVSFKVARGEVVGFLGPNGAGKSTTMRILAGLLAATSGRAYVAGIPVAARPDEVKRHLGYMPENNPLPEEMRVVEYLRFRARLKEVPRRKLKARVEEVMELCGLHRQARRRLIGALSKGFRQRVGIADAILNEPDVILMDEPTIGLDPHQIVSIRRLIDSLRGKQTVLLSSHILPEIELCCDRVMIINQGRLVAAGTSASLRRELLPRAEWRVRLHGDVGAFELLLAEVNERLRLTMRREKDADGFVELRLEAPAEDVGVGEAVLEAVMRRGQWRVREFALVDPGLEQIFMAATNQSLDETLAPYPRLRAK